MKTRSKTSFKKASVYAAVAFFLSTQSAFGYGEHEIINASVKYSTPIESAYKREFVSGALNMAVMDMVATGKRIEERANHIVQKALPKWLNVDTKLSFDKVNVGLVYKF